jgi:uracil phosphoribosyltransferase
MPPRRFNNGAVPSNGNGAPRPAAPAAARRTNVLDHPVAQHALAAMRSRHTPQNEFRDSSSQLLLHLAVEATRSLPSREESIETFAGLHSGRALARPVVFITVRRQSHGLGQVVSQIIPEVLMGTISLGHSSGSERLEPRLHMTSSPAFSDVRILLFDPVVTSGGSVCAAIDHLRRCGATDISLLSFVISGQGLARIEAALPDLTIWTAAVDRGWDKKLGPTPGLGNFSERLYG